MEESLPYLCKLGKPRIETCVSKNQQTMDQKQPQILRQALIEYIECHEQFSRLLLSLNLSIYHRNEIANLLNFLGVRKTTSAENHD